MHAVHVERRSTRESARPFHRSSRDQRLTLRREARRGLRPDRVLVGAALRPPEVQVEDGRPLLAVLVSHRSSGGAQARESGLRRRRREAAVHRRNRGRAHPGRRRLRGSAQGGGRDRGEEGRCRVAGRRARGGAAARGRYPRCLRLRLTRRISRRAAPATSLSPLLDARPGALEVVLHPKSFLPRGQVRHHRRSGDEGLEQPVPRAARDA